MFAKLEETPQQYLNRLFLDIPRGSNEEENKFEQIILPVLENKDVMSLCHIPHHHHINRLLHCLHVSYHCFLTAYRHQWDYKSAAIGGLLHDFCFYNIGKNPGKGFKNLWCFYHPLNALEEAEKRFDLNEKEKDIISKHMFPVAFSFPKYKETYAVIYWDKFCATKELLNNRLHPPVKQVDVGERSGLP